MLLRGVELRVAHGDGDEGRVDRIAGGVAEIRHGAPRRLRQQEPMAMAAFPEQPGLGQAAEAQMRHAEHDAVRQRRRGPAQNAVDFQEAERAVHGYDPIAASLRAACERSARVKPTRASMCSARYSASRATPENRPEPQV